MFALLCAFAGCLNPLPEEYPSQADSAPNPGGEMSSTPTAPESPPADTDDAPDSVPLGGDDTPARPEPDLDRNVADAGADAGAVDAGEPAVAE
ncbi:MAG TPA: hypothetical protein VMG12_23875 [Polyangiaceae bacterium]|nr:hypothetical protein [Polyangiaceae bacterium]